MEKEHELEQTASRLNTRRALNFEIRQKIRKRIYAQRRPREHLLNTQEGYRSLIIVSINHDNFALETTKKDITTKLLRSKIHIASIEETHIRKDYNYRHNEYRIITTAAQLKTPIDTKPQQGISTSGVAILIHEELGHRITNIQRIIPRITHVALIRAETNTSITILCKYAPRCGK